MKSDRIAVITAAWIAAMALPLASGEAAETAPHTVMLAVAPIGNAWRAAMLQSWDKTAGGAAPIRIAKANTLAAEAVQLSRLIVEHPAAIAIDAGSPEALNKTVRRACDAGIVVVSFDGIVTEPCAYRVQYDFGNLGQVQVEYLAKRLSGGGNLLEVRGIRDTDLDDAIHDGVGKAVAAHPSFRIVGAVHGDWEHDDAKRTTGSILPVLPKIDGVITQGGDAMGVADAFAKSHRPMPIIILGNRGADLAWWKQQQAADGYETLSVAPSPGIASLAFWVAQMVLDGKDVPHDVTMPLLTVESGDLDQALAATPADGFYSRDLTRAEAEQIVAAGR